MTRHPEEALLDEHQLAEQRRTTLQATVRCRACHRPLHDAESRTLRLGPECRDRRAARVPIHHVDQDPLFDA
ncbi:DUF6011 domain-containing protein [Streptacidiphilus sp. ASG 303]|uniref:DUF6011 domain-containing protein n=1 Tax=Streptacidiphilus sp. ASG 303 TaxID=2896847 RepID=UPI001E5EEB75|nr:DUF6011 domain-containing protein [Streptacidiphilus sp. ASG 303]MCD0486096.1 DUF6011 domain-containing protein [Streptacidiphilus sp. ASG 303]